MRAKRSKKYRKIMATYTLHFSFRTPYQVLCDSNFLRQCHAFHMPIAKFLTNTLHGEARPYITQCSLARAIADDKSRGKGRGDGKPVWLPLPTEVPLRYCKHKDAEGKELGVIGEAECLVDLVGSQPRGNETAKNKNHYVLATAEEEEVEKRDHKSGTRVSGGDGKESRKRKRGVDVREMVRRVPGVPIVYVKRSVMVLEELSAVSERVIRGIEKDKFTDGLIGDAKGLKRKRGAGEDSDDSDDDEGAREGGPKVRGSMRAKGPNPLSMRKKKERPSNEVGRGAGGEDYSAGITGAVVDGQQKRRKRKRGKKGGEDGRGDESHDGAHEVQAHANGIPIEAKS